MFPSKLYDLQLTPSLRKCISTMDQPLFRMEETQIYRKFSQLLGEDNKELIRLEKDDVMSAASMYCYGSSMYGEELQSQCMRHLCYLQENKIVPDKLKQQLYSSNVNEQAQLYLLCLLQRRKIVIYPVNPDHLECQIINFGFAGKIELARYENSFSLVQKQGTIEKRGFIKQILFDVVQQQFGIDMSEKLVMQSPQTRHKRSYSDPFKYLSDQKDVINGKKTIMNGLQNVPLSPSNISSRVSLSTTKGFNEQYVFPEHESLYSATKIQGREKYIEEINEEGDRLMMECNSFVNQDESPRQLKNSSNSNNDLLQSLALNYNDGSNFLSKNRFMGTLKFYDEAKSYGFIIMDMDGSDIFVHCDDLTKAGVNKEFLRTSKHGNLIRFSFNILEYFGKYNKSRKAVELQYLPPPPQPMIYPALNMFPPIPQTIHHSS